MLSFVSSSIGKLNDSLPTMSPTTATTFIGAIDQGTTSTRFLIFNKSGEVVALHQLEFKQIYPQSG